MRSSAFSGQLGPSGPVEALAAPGWSLFAANGQEGAQWGDMPRAGALGGPDRGPAGASALGLSLSHICTQVKEEEHKADDFTVKWAVGGEAVRLVDHAAAPGRSGGGGRRGVCQGFSRPSRLRLLERLNVIDRRKISRVIFATLTAPPDVLTWSNVHGRLRAYLGRFKRRWGSRAFVFWRLEPHASGSPHIHLLVFWVGAVPHLVNQFRPWEDAAWASVVRCPKVAITGCRTELMRGWSGVVYYCAKYLAKDQELNTSTGRMWGVACKELVPLDMREEVVKSAVGKLITRTLVRLQRKRRKRKLVWCPAGCLGCGEDGKGRWRSYRSLERWAWSSRRICVEDVIEGRVLGLGGLGPMPRDMYYRVRILRRKVGRTSARVIWGTDGEICGEERNTQAPGLHFVDAVIFERVLAWAKREVQDAIDAPPF